MDKRKESYVYIDLYDQVVNGQLVDMGFAYDNWNGSYQAEDVENRIFNLKVRGYFSED